MANDSVTIFHNPNCGTSRNVLAALNEAGVKPNVVEYLKARPRDILRTRGASEAALASVGPNATDEAILDAMVAEPVLVERPIVVTPKGTALCRPADRLQALL
jgi:arsenate reductase